MAKRLNLMLHCGGSKLDRDVLDKLKTPRATKTWTPIPHGGLVDKIQGSLEQNGYEVVSQAHGTSHNHDRYFGMFQVKGGDGASTDDGDYGLVVGMRNSHDKTFPAAIALGSGVFVCDNLAFSGEVYLSRRHTRFINRDLPQVIARGIGRLMDHRGWQDKRIDAYKNTRMNDMQAHDLIIRSLDSGCLPVTKVPAVVQEWREPQHKEFEDRNAWSLFNAYTEVLKGNARVALPRTQALHGVMDSHCGLEQDKAELVF